MQPELGSGRCRYAPLMRRAGDWWRWLSSLLLQDSFPHLLAGALLYGALSLHVELRFGTRRTVLLTLSAALAGNFLDTLIMVRSAGHGWSGSPHPLLRRPALVRSALAMPRSPDIVQCHHVLKYSSRTHADVCKSFEGI